jgi:hypothetical protein
MMIIRHSHQHECRAWRASGTVMHNWDCSRIHWRYRMYQRCLLHPESEDSWQYRIISHERGMVWRIRVYSRWLRKRSARLWTKMMPNWLTSTTRHARRYFTDVVWADVKTWTWRDLWHHPLTGFLLALILFPILAPLAMQHVTPPLLQFMLKMWLIVAVISLLLSMIFLARWWLVLLIGTTVWVLGMLVLTTLSLMACVGS